MGNYYVFVNRTKHVYLEPNDVEPGVAKKFQIISHEETKSLLVWAMLGPWLGDSIECTVDDAVYADDVDYRNVTRELIEARRKDDPGNT